MSALHTDRERAVLVPSQREWISVTALTAPTVFMATAEGLVCLDLIAVELAVNGEHQAGELTPPEAAYAADIMLQRGMDRSVIARRAGMDHRTLRAWFPTDDTPLCEALQRARTAAEWCQEMAKQLPAKPPIRCGTYRGAQRHRRRKEPCCEPCRLARNAADRHFRKHGTYSGAPEFPA
ncbi:hypothetical protein OHB41_21185 [Streptomyces sp. NBC_01571]|uniref:hypothetical protein n=1 Tax=Streptomyces sp. NBC_01571 TaxID=2975883 RepID=UPI00224E6F89|nr:hypothetical protein [Streptomyces sp. NBC_01571]MCX4575659.1 hypothetical protein [Streptomyces sp. NBC_01571]